jgi:hypothetical protein
MLPQIEAFVKVKANYVPIRALACGPVPPMLRITSAALRYWNMGPHSVLLEPHVNLRIHQCALTSAASLARATRAARLWLTSSANSRSHLGIITGTAVLEFGPAERLSPVGAISPAYPRLCRPRRVASPAHPREKPGFSTSARGFPRDADSDKPGDPENSRRPGER